MKEDKKYRNILQLNKFKMSCERSETSLPNRLFAMLRVTIKKMLVYKNRKWNREIKQRGFNESHSYKQLLAGIS